MVIQIRKYDNIVDLIKQPVGIGKIWSAYEVQPGSHYEPIKRELEKMPLEKRHMAESKQMESLQSDDVVWRRYYAISTAWVSKWLAFVQAADKNTAVPPGPVDNRIIAR